MEDNKLGVLMSADTPSSTGVAGDTVASTSLLAPILPKYQNKFHINKIEEESILI